MMRPVEHGGIVVESPEEATLVLFTLSAAMVSTPVGQPLLRAHAFQSLAEPLETALENGSLPVALDVEQTALLKEACRAADLNLGYGLGVLACYMQLTGRTRDEALRSMKDSPEALFRSARILCVAGPSSALLSGLIDLYGTEESGSPE